MRPRQLSQDRAFTDTNMNSIQTAHPPLAYALGTMALTGHYGPIDRRSASQTILHFLDTGGTVVDTADLYGDGASETLIGETLVGKRHDAHLASKFGYIFGASADQRRLDAHPARVEPACDESLRRLRTDYLDLYYLHRVDPNIPVEETIGAMAKLVQKGKVRSLGICEISPKTLASAQKIHPISAVQSEYSLWSRDPETELQAFASTGAAFYGYAPLGRGFLSGSIRTTADFAPEDQRRDLPRFQGSNFALNLRLVDELQKFATELQVTAAELAIAWCMRNRKVRPIVGATAPEHVDDANRAARLVVPATVWERLDAVFPVGAAAGTRYSDSAMKRLETGR